jgi:hypothetical protein
MSQDTASELLGALERARVAIGYAERMDIRATEANVRADGLEALLKEAHDAMDDLNADDDAHVVGCGWCQSFGYDGDGLNHKDDCILVRIRQALP